MKRIWINIMATSAPKIPINTKAAATGEGTAEKGGEPEWSFRTNA